LRTIRELMILALEREASDLHLVAGTPPCLRIHGAIHFLEDEPLQGDQIREMVQEILSPAQVKRLESELELELSYTEPSLGRFRVALFFERANLAAAFRVVPLKVRSVHDLNLPLVVHDLARRQAGLLLIAGATGQGKTTTMNAMIDLINSERRARIITIEDPIEFVHRHRRSVILQREVESDTHSFNRALISALRQDPNVICVGEMRDLETIGTALTAAETGHLVISTLHTQSASQTMDRIIDVFPGHQQNQVRLQLANSLQGVICQKLLPRVAGDGRILAFEIMIATPAVRHLIREGKMEQIHNVLVTGKEQGMIPMDHCIRLHYERGLISYDVAVSNALDPESFRSLRVTRESETPGPLTSLPGS
jgi:twitching motility protein PilT